MTTKQENFRKKKLGIIHILLKQLIDKGELDERGYRDSLRRDYDAGSSAELSIDQLEHFIQDLEALGGVITRRPRWSRNKQRIPAEKKGKFEPSLDGLREEVTHLAKHRFGDRWEKPLNKLCFTAADVDHWKFLDVRKAKIVKEVLLRLDAKGPYRKRTEGRYRAGDARPGVHRAPEEDPIEGQEFHDDAINGGSYVR